MTVRTYTASMVLPSTVPDFTRMSAAEVRLHVRRLAGRGWNDAALSAVSGLGVVTVRRMLSEPLEVSR